MERFISCLQDCSEFLTYLLLCIGVQVGFFAPSLLRNNWYTKKLHIINVYNLVSLGIYIYIHTQSCYDHHNQGHKLLRYPQKNNEYGFTPPPLLFIYSCYMPSPFNVFANGIDNLWCCLSLKCVILIRHVQSPLLVHTITLLFLQWARYWQNNSEQNRHCLCHHGFHSSGRNM